MPRIASHLCALLGTPADSSTISLSPALNAAFGASHANATGFYGLQTKGMSLCPWLPRHKRFIYSYLCVGEDVIHGCGGCTTSLGRPAARSCCHGRHSRQAQPRRFDDMLRVAGRAALQECCRPSGPHRASSRDGAAHRHLGSKHLGTSQPRRRGCDQTQRLRYNCSG